MGRPDHRHDDGRCFSGISNTTADFGSVIAKLETVNSTELTMRSMKTGENDNDQSNDQSVLVLPSSQFQIDPSSVIKTAPPGRLNNSTDSSTFGGLKHEAPLELAPLMHTASLQDLSKMQPMDYYTVSAGYSRMYSTDYTTIAGLAPPTAQPSLLPPGPSYYSSMFPVASGTDWSRSGPMTDPYGTYQTVRPMQPIYSQETGMDDLNSRLHRTGMYKPMNVEMPSPVDSGIGVDITPNKETDGFAPYQLQGDVMQSLGPGPITPSNQIPVTVSVRSSGVSVDRSVGHRESPVHIPKLNNVLGFQYLLEAPISTSVRKEDDHMTYVNKGQFYPISLDYIPEPCKPLKSQTVRSVLMVVFREDKSYEEEIKAWQFWHTRQHSPKQRIMEVDAKNSSGIIGQVEEIAYNAVQFYWNPSEQNNVKLSISIQCLSTDFSNQKGVKGLPLHIQIDTFDETVDTKTPFHRGYCQIKVFCDKGANRKMLHENRRDEKRRLQGRKKSDSEYHDFCDRSEFYHMSDLDKPPALFIGPDEYDPRFPLDPSYSAFDPTLMSMSDLTDSAPGIKRPRQMSPNGITLYVRKQEEHIFTTLNLMSSSVQGLANAMAGKFALEPSKITGAFIQDTKGNTLKADDDFFKYGMKSDKFAVRIEQANDDPSCCTVTLIELENRALTVFASVHCKSCVVCKNCQEEQLQAHNVGQTQTPSIANLHVQ